jgi:hypothetical protein
MDCSRRGFDDRVHDHSSTGADAVRAVYLSAYRTSGLLSGASTLKAQRTVRHEWQDRHRLHRPQRPARQSLSAMPGFLCRVVAQDGRSRPNQQKGDKWLILHEQTEAAHPGTQCVMTSSRPGPHRHEPLG